MGLLVDDDDDDDDKSEEGCDMAGITIYPVPEPRGDLEVDMSQLGESCPRARRRRPVRCIRAKI